MTSTSTASDIQARLSGRYRIERLLGRGGMGAVYLARDLTLDRLVAVKELPEEFASDPALRERFLREVRMAASFSHPNIVPVYAIEEDGAFLAFVMGYVEGESLAERVRRAGPLSAREAVRLLLDVAYALAYAHGRGVVHRDLKPDNVMIERATGRALLMDFGVARAITASPRAQPGMTRVGEVVGTPEYMSPEQATGEDVDGRSDLYSLGLTARFAVTGNVAFGGDSAARVLVRQLTETLPPLATVRPDLPSQLAEAMDRCLAKARDERFADAAELIEALDAAQSAAPEIPVAIRLLSNELSVLQTLGVFAIFLLLVGVGSLKVSLSALVMVAIFWGRVLQTRAEVRRIRDAGFSGDDTHRGLLAVLGEREERRQQLRANPVMVSQRARTARIARILLIGAVISAAIGIPLRDRIDGFLTFRPLGFALVLTSVISFGIGLVLLLRNPLKAPGDERVFRALWLGPIGRALFGFSRTNATRATSGSTRPAQAAAGTPAATSGPASSSSPVDARLRDLEARVRRLEQR